VSQALARLEQDLASGAWSERYGHLLGLDVCDCGYRLVVAEGAPPLYNLPYYSYNTPSGKEGVMLDNPVAKRTAVAAGIGALIAIPVPFVGPIFGAIVGAGYGFVAANRRG